MRPSPPDLPGARLARALADGARARPSLAPSLARSPTVRAVQESVTQPSSADRVWTVPNALSVLRLGGIALFLWLVLGPEQDEAAFAVLVVSGATDWLDGYLARRLGQYSRLGELLDPLADRLYIFAVVLGLALRHIVPWWVALLLPLRDVLLWGLVPFLRSRGYRALPVHFLGKAATFNLLYAFPLLLLAHGDGVLSMLCRVLGWSFAIWGIGLYWWAGILYALQTRQLVRMMPPQRPTRRPVSSRRGR